MPGSPRGWTAVLPALYVALACATTASWEWTHDEALTLDVAVARAPTARALRAPVPIGELLAGLAVAPGDGPADLIDYIGRPGIMFHPPGYYLLVQGWARVFGTSRWSLRAPAVLLGLAALLAMRRCARRLLPRPGADLAAAGLLALSPWFLYQTVNVRPYAVAVCLALLSTAAVLEIGERRRAPGWRLAFVAVSVAGLYTLYHYAFVLVWQGVLLLACAVRRERGARAADLAALAAMTGAIGLAFVPWLDGFRTQLGQADLGSYYFSGALPIDAWPAALAELMRQFLLGRIGASRGGLDLTPALAILGAATLALLAARAIRPARPPLPSLARRAWLTAPLLPLAFLALDAWRDMHAFFIGHANFVLFPGLLLVIAGVWTAVGRRLAAAGLLAWALVSCAATVSEASRRAGSRNAFEVIAEQVAAADHERHLVAVSAANRGYLLTLLLTLRDAGVRRARLVHAADDPPSLVANVAAGDGYDRITLVDFDISYSWGEQGWSADALDQAERRAREAGWRVVRLDPRAGAAEPPTGARLVLIADPAPVRY